MRSVIAMPELSPKKIAAKKLLFSALIESLAIVAGVLAYGATSNWVWLAIGVLGGTAFTLPAIIVFVRASMEERNRASR